MEENDANRANYTELMNHIGRLNKKIGALPEGAARDEAKEDRDDYWERLLQCKNMRVTTLECDLMEKTKAQSELEKKLKQSARRQWQLIMVLLAVAVAIFEYTFDAYLTGKIMQTCLFIGERPLLLVSSTACIVFFVTRWLVK